MNTSLLLRSCNLNVLLGLGILSALMLLLPEASSAKEACVRTSNSGVVCGQLVPKPTNVPNRPDPISNSIPSEKIEQDGLSFQSLGCKVNNKDKGIVCDVVVNNLRDSTRTIRIHGSSYGNSAPRAIEPNGGTFFADGAYIGSNKDVSSPVDLILNPSLPSKTTLQFSGVSKNAVKLIGLAFTYFDVEGSSIQGEAHTPILRNISIR